MTRNEIHESYKIDANGIIRSPGKFEGEMLYAVHFWDLSLNGDADDETIDPYTASFNVTKGDRIEFPELGKARRVLVTEGDNGFVHCRTQEGPGRPANTF